MLVGEGYRLEREGGRKEGSKQGKGGKGEEGEDI